MTQPATKTVFGRVFHATSDGMEWLCKTNQGEVVLLPLGEHWSATFEVTIGFTRYRAAKAFGPTESDAILALQSTLRKMAELEVAK